jgi:hypothetical protein
MSKKSEYDAGLRKLIKWYQENRISLPDEKFDLCPGTTVVDAPRFYAALDRDISVGSCGHTLDMSLKRQLEMLKAYVDSKERSGR